MHNITKTRKQSDDSRYGRGVWHTIRHKSPEVQVTIQFSVLQGTFCFIVDVGFAGIFQHPSLMAAEIT